MYSHPAQIEVRAGTDRDNEPSFPVDGASVRDTAFDLRPRRARTVTLPRFRQSTRRRLPRCLFVCSPSLRKSGHQGDQCPQDGAHHE